MVRQRGALAKIARPRLHDVVPRTRLIRALDSALIPSSPERALQLLQAGRECFVATSDAAGQFACGAAPVQTLWYARPGWSGDPVMGRSPGAERAGSAPRSRNPATT